MRISIKNILSLLLTLLAGFANAQQKADSIKKRVDRLAANLIDEKKAVGLSIGIYENGKSYFFNYGVVSLDRPAKPDKNTLYEIGSISKTLESYILANAVLEGRLQLTDDIRKYLQGNYPNLAYQGQPIQLIHLANTTSLLPDWLPELPAAMKGMTPDSALAIKIDYYKNLSRQDFFNALHNVKPDTIPGTKRYHSNAGAQLLAYILEDVYKMPMDRLLKKYITTPGKMKHTFFINSARAKGIATGYTATNTKAVYEYSMPYFKYAGGLASSTSDMVKYIALMLQHGNKGSMLTLQKTADINASTGKIVAMKPVGTADPTVYSAALNWFSYQPDSMHSQVWADGGTNGFNSYIVLYPLQKSGIVLLANKSDEKIFRALPGMAREISKMLGSK